MSNGLTIPYGAQPLVATSGQVAAAVAAAALAADASRFNWLTGFDITGGGATAGQLVIVTVTGLQGGTITFVMASGTGVTAGTPELSKRFPHPLRSSAKNVAITVSAASFGAGNTNAVTNVYGYSSDI